jgi:hypothetical protein
MGIGTNGEQVKVHRRDAMSWTIRREEGTIYNYYRFLRVRWEGYSQYSMTSADVKLVWDLLLLDTGDIVLHFETIPTNTSYLGECTLVTSSGNIAFTPTVGGIVTFLHQNDTGTSFVLSQELPVLLDPYNRRYLITDATGALYTVEEGSLLKLSETELTAEVFETYGVQDIPDGALLLTLVDPTISTGTIPRTGSRPSRRVIRRAETAGNLLGNIDMSDSSIIGIEKVTVTAMIQRSLPFPLMPEKAGGPIPAPRGKVIEKHPVCRKPHWKLSLQMHGQRKPSPAS